MVEADEEMIIGEMLPTEQPATVEELMEPNPALHRIMEDLKERRLQRATWLYPEEMKEFREGLTPVFQKRLRLLQTITEGDELEVSSNPYI